MNRILSGIKVLDMSHLISGPYCSLVLSDLGAEVTKLEPRTGDAARTFGPPFVEGESGVFLGINRNKKSITLDLKREEGRELFYRIVKGFDVLIENYRYGAAERLSIGYEKIKEINDKIIYCSIKSFPPYEPLNRKIGVDPIFQAMSGTMGVTGVEGGPPVKVGIPIVDMSTGLYAAIAILAALRDRDLTHRPSKIDINLFDVILSLQATMASIYFATGEDPMKLGTGHHFSAPSQAFKTKDNRHVILSAYDERFWLELCEILHVEYLAEDERFLTNERRMENRSALAEIIQEIIQTKTEEEWLEILEGKNIPYAPVLKYSDIFQEDGPIYKNSVIELNHVKAGRIRVLKSPISFEEHSERASQPPPLLGEHNDEFYGSLGLTPEEIESYRERGVI